MRFGQGLSVFMDEQDLTLGEVGAIANVSGSQVHKIVKGTRRPQKDVMRSISTEMDCGELMMFSTIEVTGGACPPYLNNVDLHQAAVALKTIEENEETNRAIRDAPLHKRREELTEDDRKKIRKTIKETIESITAQFHLVVVLCKQYGFSWIAVWKDHWRDMKIKKYLR